MLAPVDHEKVESRCCRPLQASFDDEVDLARGYQSIVLRHERSGLRSYTLTSFALASLADVVGYGPQALCSSIVKDLAAQIAA